jgi:metallo-beta-lactamase family protein
MMPQNEIRVRFFGAAGTVTGSKFLVETAEKNILIDCGLFQGLKSLRILNWTALPVNASEIDMVLLTHGHLDHVGYLPKLVKEGFKGPVVGSAPTTDIARVILLDSAKIQEEEAERANREGYSKHKPAKPLYSVKDAEKVLPLFRSQKKDEWLSISEHIRCRFRYAGHILGACFIELEIFGKMLVFSGDIGRANDELLYAAEKPETADALFMESTYGHSIHPLNAFEQLRDTLCEAAQKKGSIIIPGFAVERAQLLIYMIAKLRKEKSIPDIPVYVDSPMAAEVFKLFGRYAGWQKLNAGEWSEILKQVHIIQKPSESETLVKDKSSKIVIAGSGMGGGGRVLAWFQEYLGNPSATVVLTGYQAEGTRGRALLEGAPEIRLFGKFYKVKAAVRSIEGLSAHADCPGLISWLSGLKTQSPRIFLVHGEKNALHALQNEIRDRYGWESHIPQLNETVRLFN